MPDLRHEFGAMRRPDSGVRLPPRRVRDWSKAVGDAFGEGEWNDRVSFSIKKLLMVLDNSL
jgi:hypothetical protein